MKPGNVMLLEQGDEQDYVKVLDFGLVKDLDAAEEEDLTQTGVFMGSPKYMSPEQIQGERVDGRSDIYSIGVILFELLSGSPPFVRDKQVQVLMDHINAPVPQLAAPEGMPPLPAELTAIVYKCLAKTREDRFEDMDGLLAALKVLAGGMASGELGMSGDRLHGGTPVSGVHTVSSDALRTTGSGSISAPTVTGSGASGGVSLAGPMGEPVTGPRGGGKGRGLAIGLALVGLLIVVGIGIGVADPFARPGPPALAPAPAPPVASAPVDPPRAADPLRGHPGARAGARDPFGDRRAGLHPDGRDGPHR